MDSTSNTNSQQLTEARRNVKQGCRCAAVAEHRGSTCHMRTEAQIHCLVTGGTPFAESLPSQLLNFLTLSIIVGVLVTFLNSLLQYLIISWHCYMWIVCLVSEAANGVLALAWMLFFRFKEIKIKLLKFNKWCEACGASWDRPLKISCSVTWPLSPDNPFPFYLVTPNCSMMLLHFWIE